MGRCFVVCMHLPVSVRILLPVKVQVSHVSDIRVLKGACSMQDGVACASLALRPFATRHPRLLENSRVLA